MVDEEQQTPAAPEQPDDPTPLRTEREADPEALVNVPVTPDPLSTPDGDGRR